MPRRIAIEPGMLRLGLRRVPLLSGWSDAELDRVLRVAESWAYAKGEMICEAAKPVRPGLYVVLSGTVRLHHDWQDGRHMLQAVYFPGQLLQLCSLADTCPETFSCSARSDARLVFLPRGPLMETLCANPDRMLALAGQLSTRSRIDHTALKLKLRGCHRSHLAAALWYYARNASLGGAAGDASHDLTQDELAAMLGIARQTVNRLMGQLVRDRIIVREGRETRVLDFDKLAAIAEEDGPLPDLFASSRSTVETCQYEIAKEA